MRTRTALAGAVLVGLVLTATPANAMSYIQADTPQVTRITKASARLHCVFHVALGQAAYPWIVSYRTTDGASKSWWMGAKIGSGTHTLTQDRTGLYTGTTYTVRCEASYASGGQIAASARKNFATISATDFAPMLGAFRDWAPARRL